MTTHSAATNQLSTITGASTRVMLIDGHTILREGLSALISVDGSFSVVGQASSVSAAIPIAVALRPDLIVTDFSFPDSTGTQSIVELRRSCPKARIVVFTMHDSEEHIRAGLTAGADGYILKYATHAELTRGLKAVVRGERYLCPRSSSCIVRSYLGEAPSASPVPATATVTVREREILALIAGGQPNKRIAKTLGRSVKTVEKHRANLMRKLGLHNAADVTRFAIRSGVLGTDVTVTI